MAQSQTGERDDIDVIIIGAGIQGLWLLCDLVDANLNAVLLERRYLGFGQTGHSHLFLHEGHMFASGQRGESMDAILRRVVPLRDAHREWTAALGAGGRLESIPRLTTDFYIGWTDLLRAAEFRDICEAAALRCDEVVAIPQAFGNLEQAFSSTGLCLDAEDVLSALLDYKNVARRVSACESVSISKTQSDQVEVTATSRGKTITLKAKALVLTAGAGNERMIQYLTGNSTAVVGTPRQQTVKTFMLVVRDLYSRLNPTAGMFRDFGGLFIAPRVDDEGRTVLLIADRQRALVSVPGEMTAFDAASWFGAIRLELERLLPALFTSATQFEWGIYEATKAESWTPGIGRFSEGGRLPEGFSIHDNGSAPVWVIWPTLLTLAPIASMKALDSIRQRIPASTQASDPAQPWKDFCVVPIARRDRWRTTPLQSWQSFAACYVS